MNREKLLAILSDLPFTMIWPGNWDDIGFTERPIWVNAKGYGYIKCDEPCASIEVDGLPLEKWREVLTKLNNDTLQMSDIKETSLADLLHKVTYGYFDEDEHSLCDVLQGLLQLSDEKLDRIFGLESIDGWQFFSSEEKFNGIYERDWADEYWSDLEDDMLYEWIDRLSVESDFRLKSWTNRHNLEQKDNDGRK